MFEDWNTIYQGTAKLFLPSLYKYTVTTASFKKNIYKIYPPLQLRNMKHLDNRDKLGEVKSGTVREVLGFNACNTKIGKPTDLSKDEESFFSSYDVKGLRGLTMYYNYMADYFQCVAKSFKRWHDNTGIDTS